MARKSKSVKAKKPKAKKRPREARQGESPPEIESAAEGSSQREEVPSEAEETRGQESPAEGILQQPVFVVLSPPKNFTSSGLLSKEVIFCAASAQPALRRARRAAPVH